ncbi:medium-chain fatty acid-CoA ligase FAA2 [Ascoidea rubescens DSM 1968]|uniref:Acetyl-CoA synthetase-like protein n=1 Tax=Ascoidea rubescens DSM 1968 TaxID=1344418 RepID=A0A1D2VS61_9ASCO|nr:acetyl-CoA synthetase-like protein [Ascoidea rubescens DSM 1968]ODV64446.1 acetyl-CoA synthetase-like protein [Ascoidea rubescens DSM 1968]
MDAQFDNTFGYRLSDAQKKEISDVYDNLPLPTDQIDVGLPIPNSQKDSHSHIYRPSKLVILNSTTPDNQPSLISYIHPFVDTYFKIFEVSANLWPDHNCLGKRLFNNTAKNQFDRFYTFQSYSKIRERRNNLGAGILSLVLNNKTYKRFKDIDSSFYTNENYNYPFLVSLYSSNRLEWLLTDLACQSYSLPNTALYDTLGPETSKYILEITESPILFCSYQNISKVLKLKQDHPISLQKLAIVVSFDNLNPEKDNHLISLSNSLDLQLLDLRNVEKIGKLFPIPLNPSKPDDLYTISFTSGTTGLPKGVEMTQRNLLSGITFAFTHIDQPRALCFLPLAHIFERQVSAYQITCGVAIAFPSSSIPVNSLMEDIRVLRPHILSAVPRVFTKIESSLKQSIKNSNVFQKYLLEKSIRDKEQVQSLEPDNKGESWLFDRLVVDKTRHTLGFDNMQFCVTGSAPIAPETVKFLKAILGMGFKQGYGLTESMAGVTISRAYEKEPGSCGVGGLTCEFRLKSVPNMNYNVDDPDGIPKGELLLRGPQIFPRYFKNEKATLESFDEDGFFLTGDIAKVDTKNVNRLYIIDRVKNFFKLSQGEYIAPEKIENIYLSTCPILTQVFVYGNSFKNYLVSIVGVDALALKKNDLELLRLINSHYFLKKTILSFLNKQIQSLSNKERKSILQNFEKIHNLYLAINPLTIENNLITPTFKVKRNVCASFFKDKIDLLYQEGSLIKDDVISKL